MTSALSEEGSGPHMQQSCGQTMHCRSKRHRGGISKLCGRRRLWPLKRERAKSGGDVEMNSFLGGGISFELGGGGGSQFSAERELYSY